MAFILDASAKVHSTSFNDANLPGLDLLSSLVSVLVKFYQYLVGYSSDIFEMFHQVKIREEWIKLFKDFSVEAWIVSQNQK